MTEEIESPVEGLAEELHEKAVHAGEAWLKYAALFSGIFAVFAAIAGLQSAHYANTAMIEQIQASDQWGYYQAKGVKANILESEQSILKQIGKVPHDLEKLAKYRQEQRDIEAAATEKVAAAKAHLDRHEILSYAVTMFQVAIALIAIAVLARQRSFLLFSGLLGAAGAFFFIQGLL